MKDQFATPDRRVKYTGPQNRRNAPGFKTPVGSFDGERVNYTDRRRSSSPVDRRSNRAYKMGDPQRRITRNSYGRRDGDPQRAKAAGQFVPRSYLKAAVTQAIRDFVPPKRVADRRDPNKPGDGLHYRRVGVRRMAGDRRKVLMTDRPVRRNGYGRRVGDTVSYMTLPAGGRYVKRLIGADLSAGAFTPTNVTNFALAPVKRVYDSEAARDDINLARELAELLIKVRDEVTAKSAVRASLIAVTRRIEEREKNA